MRAARRDGARRRPAWIRWADAASIVAFGVAWAAVILRLAPEAPAARLAWILPLAAGLGFALADFLGGCVHWLADRYFHPTTPVLGPMLIEPFRDHHRDPKGIARHGSCELLGNNALGTLPLALALLVWGPPGPGVLAQGIQWTVTALALALFATNLFHRWAHEDAPPAVARWLQAHGLVLTPAGHDRHHRGPHDCSYCVTSGWLNPFLDRTEFFRRVEGRLERLGVSRPDPRLTESARAAPR